MYENKNDVRLWHVVCPSSDVPARAIRRRQGALAMFDNLCPTGARVADILAIRGTKSYKCAWKVEYVLNVTTKNLPELIREIENSKPNNTTIIEQKKRFPATLEMVYSINCACTEFGFVKCENSDSLDIKREAVDHIYMDIVKVERPEQE